MKKYIFKVIALIGVLLFLDLIGGSVLEHYFSKQKRGKYFVIAQALDSIKPEILILGSSRANNHYNSSIIESITSRETFNAGYGGHSIIYANVILQELLERHSPTLIIYDAYKNPNELNKLSVLNPFVNSHKHIRGLIYSLSIYEERFFYSRLYPYNSVFFSILYNNYSSDRKDVKGFIPIISNPKQIPKNNCWHEESFKKNETLSFEDQLRINSFNEMAKSLDSLNIPFIVLTSPIYCNAYNDSLALLPFKESMDKYDVSFISFANVDPFNNNSELFHEAAHLNSVGADVFSKMVADTILTLYPQLK